MTLVKGGETTNFSYFRRQTGGSLVADTEKKKKKKGKELIWEQGTEKLKNSYLL